MDVSDPLWALPPALARKNEVGARGCHEKSTEYIVLVSRVLKEILELHATVDLCCFFILMGVFFSPEKNC